MKSNIAVVIPAYNAEKYLEKCLDSVQRQSFQEWKCIIVDDGSIDNTGIIAEKYVETDSRFFLLHQENKGSVAARRTGVLSDCAQSCPFLTFLDADDTLPPTALSDLYSEIVEGVDVAVGRTKRVWKSIDLGGYKSPCLTVTAPHKYNHKEIINELLIGYFGKTDFPVNLNAKLYRTDLITKAVCNPAIVKFMGEDLSVSIRVVTSANSLVIVPKTVYNYRIGGGTSRFQPDMMNDFIALYKYKYGIAMQYPMPQDWQYLMDVELMNTTKTHFQQCIKSHMFSDEKLREEVYTVCSNETVHGVAMGLKSAGKGASSYAHMIAECDVQGLIIYNKDIVKKQYAKDFIKSILIKL